MPREADSGARDTEHHATVPAGAILNHNPEASPKSYPDPDDSTKPDPDRLTLPSMVC